MELTMKHAEKLLGLYARQLETLNKHRGKGRGRHAALAPGGVAAS